jgi:hypothetical protein
MISNNKISNLVATQLPFFVRNDHENFVAFLEAYYEFLEQETGAGNVSRSLLEQADIDMSDLFVQRFYDNFLPFIPKDTAADKTLILKNVKDFYRSRGSEKSIRFLMRVLFNEEMDFYYPQKDVLKASDGKWFIEKSIKVSDIEIDSAANSDLNAVNTFIGRRIVGENSNAFAIVENTDTYYEGGSLVRELKISGQVGEFSSGEKIHTVFIENGIERTLSANLFSGSINTVEVKKAGSGYIVGQTVKIESNTGNGAAIIVSSVSTGNLTSIVAFDGGAGFQINNPILVTGGGGSGANAAIATVSANGYFHSNTYNIAWSTIGLEANTTIGNTTYSNLNISITDPANNWVQNLLSFFSYTNTGPIETIILYNPGFNYSGKPSITSQANTRIRNLGILGRMRIIDGGQGYNVNDSITFINSFGSYGNAAAARVRAVNVSAGNAISEVEFVNVPGHITGGSGYSQLQLPSVNVISTNTQAFGANIIVTAVLGSGETLQSVGSTAGSIQQLTVILRGSGYEEAPILNLSEIGDGTAQAVATIITGAYTYPGRYINDDGHLSSYNFIQDRDYYQKFSYVLKLKQSIDKYRTALKTLIHPAGMKLFGEYMFVDENQMLKVNIKSVTENVNAVAMISSNYLHANGNVTIEYNAHTLSTDANVYLVWSTGNLVGNATSGYYKVKTVVNSNAFIILTNNQYISNTNPPKANSTGIVYVDKFFI